MANFDKKIINIAMGGEHVLALRQDNTLVAWGSNESHQCDIPENLHHIKSISTGNDFSMVLESSGRVVVWGLNDEGQCDVPESLGDVVSISAGYQHALAVTSDGRVVAWGQNTDGQCDVPYSVNDVVAVSAGVLHSLALTRDGHVLAWGNNDSGQCDVPQWLANVVAIAAGKYHSLAITQDGQVVAWGYSQYGQCDVPSMVVDVVSIATSESHVLALTGSGKVYSWGNNAYFECNVPDDVTDATAVCASKYYSLVLHNDGRVSAWGGEGLKNRVSSRMVNINALSIDAGENHSVLLKDSGSVETWPFNHKADCDVPNIDINASFVSAGDMHSLAITSDKHVYAWGNNDSGQCDVPSYVANIAHVAAGGQHSLAVTCDGRVYAWGNNIYKQCSVPADLTDVVSVAAGMYHSLAVMRDGRTVAWGMFVDLHDATDIVHVAAGAYYSLAVTNAGTIVNGGWERENPRDLSDVTKVSVGSTHSLALTKYGQVTAWGANDSGQCDVPVWLTDVEQIAAGGLFSLAKLRDGKVVTWGGNSIIDTQRLVQIGTSTRLEYIHPFLKGHGYEAKVYSTPSGLLKRYTSLDNIPSIAKLEYMMSHAVESWLHRPTLAWPQQMAFDPFTGQLVGYVMPFVAATLLLDVLAPSSRRQHWPELATSAEQEKRFVLTVALGCAQGLMHIHQNDYVVGDMSPRNIMIYPDMTVAYIDCASYQIKDGSEYGCRVSTPDYHAPEVKTLENGRIKYSVHTDAFTLAVIIFRLLSDNIHPYQGITLPSPQMNPARYEATQKQYPQLTQLIPGGIDATTYCFMKRIWPYNPHQHVCVPPPGQSEFFEQQPKEIRDLFYRAFVNEPEDRPTPAEWASVLGLILNEL